MIRARTALVLDEPFFGVLALRLRLIVDPSCDTAWTDGTSIGYSAEFVEKLSFPQKVALIAHEVLHCAMGHPWRRGGRDHRRWNVACDYAINWILKESGFVLPEGALIDPQYAGKSAEWIYDRLPQGENGGGGSGGDPGGDGAATGEPGAGNPLGEVRDAPNGSAQDGNGEADWQGAVQQAEKVARQAGKLGGGLERFAKSAARSRVDWKSVLRRFVTSSAAADYSWARPNRRYLPRGLYLPSLHSEAMGTIVVAIDTSGSIDEVLLGQFQKELQSIADELRPESVIALACDTSIRSEATFLPDEPIKLSTKGGGGTAFGPVFDWLEKSGETPACVIYFTDLYSCDLETLRPADVPVLWAVDGDAREVPFGEVLEIGG